MGGADCWPVSESRTENILTSDSSSDAPRPLWWFFVAGKHRGTQRAFFIQDDLQPIKMIIQPSLCFFRYFSLLLGKKICSALPARRLNQFQLPARQGGQFPAGQHHEIVSQRATKKANNCTQANTD